MPFGWDDRFNASPGPLDPRFQGVSGTIVAAPTVQIGVLTLVGVSIISTNLCSSIPFVNLLAYRTEAQVSSVNRCSQVYKPRIIPIWEAAGSSFDATSAASVIKTV